MPTPPIRSPFRHLLMVLGPAIAGSDPTLVFPRNGARRVYRRSRTTKGAPDIAIAVPICVMVSMGFAVALVPLRSHVNGYQTTVALALMVLVVFAASIGGRAAGVSTALVNSKVLYQGSGLGFELPRDGVALAVLASGREVGWFVMTPTTGVGTSLDECIVAVAVADQVGAAIALRDAKTYKEDHSHG